MESPTRYHLWSAITVVSHALGRRVWLNRKGRWMTYPAQTMTMLIGPSGVRKTRAIQQAKQLIVAARLRLPASAMTNIHVMAQRMSTEALFADMVPLDDEGMRADSEKVDCIGFLIAGEMAATFGNASYMEGLSTAIMEIHDSQPGAYNPRTKSFEPFEFRSQFQKDGPDQKRLRNPAITLLTATTPVGLAEGLPPHVRSDGFLGRIVPVWAGEPGRAYNPMLGEPDEDELATPDELIDGLATMAEMSGQAWLTKDAEAAHIDWYTRVDAQFMRDTNTTRRAFYNRMEDHAHRVAIVLACIDALGQGKTGHRDVCVKEEHSRRAGEWIEDCARRLPECYAALRNRTPHQGAREYIIDLVTKHGKQGGWYTFRSIVKRASEASDHAWKTALLREEIIELVSLGMLEWSKDKLSLRKCSYTPNPWSGRQANVDRHFVAGINRQLEEDADDSPDEEWADEYAELAEEQRRRDRGDDDDND
jgi:hypothetical protein